LTDLRIYDFRIHEFANRSIFVLLQIRQFVNSSIRKFVNS